MPSVLVGAFTALNVFVFRKEAPERLPPLEAALLDVFELGDPSLITHQKAAELLARHVDSSRLIVDPKTGTSIRLFTAYSKARSEAGEWPASTLMGYAFEFEGMGYCAPIKGVLAVDARLESILGIAFTELKETQGIGSRVNERWFREQFIGRSIFENPRALKPISVGPRKPPIGTHMVNRHVDAISGATMTCQALEAVLCEAIESFHRAMKNAATEVSSADPKAK